MPLGNPICLRLLGCLDLRIDVIIGCDLIVRSVPALSTPKYFSTAV